MKDILMTLLLIIVAIMMYMTLFGGEEGMERELRDNGLQMNRTIERINLYGEGAVR